MRYADVRKTRAARGNDAGHRRTFINEWIEYVGRSARARAQYLILGGKARALLHGRTHVSLDDVRSLVHPCLRHRILVGYRAEAEGVTVGQVIDRLLEHVSVG